MGESIERFELSPEEFELEVKKQFDRMSKGLKNYKSDHRQIVPGMDGEYEIDIVASFEQLGLNFKVLIECKHYKRRVEREDFLVLQEKMTSLGAQKSVLVTSFGFQSGALEYAKKHGIGAIVLRNAQFFRIAKAMTLPPTGYDRPIPTLVLTTLTEAGFESFHNLSLDDKSSMADIFVVSH